MPEKIHGSAKLWDQSKKPILNTMDLPWEHSANIYFFALIWAIAQPPQLNSSSNPVSGEKIQLLLPMEVAPQGIQSISKTQAVATKSKGCVRLTVLLGQETCIVRMFVKWDFQWFPPSVA